MYYHVPGTRQLPPETMIGARMAAVTGKVVPFGLDRRLFSSRHTVGFATHFLPEKTRNFLEVAWSWRGEMEPGGVCLC